MQIALPEISCSQNWSLADLVFSVVILDPVCQHLLLQLSLCIQQHSHPSVTSTTFWMGYCCQSSTARENTPNPHPPYQEFCTILRLYSLTQHSMASETTQCKTQPSTKPFPQQVYAVVYYLLNHLQEITCATLEIGSASFCMKPPLKVFFFLESLQKLDIMVFLF